VDDNESEAGAALELQPLPPDDSEYDHLESKCESPPNAANFQCLKTIADYDGIETTEDGMEEGGYLQFVLGEYIQVISPDPVPGHQANRFQCYVYGQVQDCAQRQGWLPLAVLESVSAGSA